MRGDRGAQELVADVGAVAPERLGPRLLAGRLLERLDDRRRERQRDVADAEVGQPDAGVGVAIGLGAPLDLGEEIARLQVQEGLVDPGHAPPAFPEKIPAEHSRRQSATLPPGAVPSDQRLIEARAALDREEAHAPAFGHQPPQPLRIREHHPDRKRAEEDHVPGAIVG